MSDCVISITEYMHVILIRKFPTSVCMIKFSRISNFCWNLENRIGIFLVEYTSFTLISNFWHFEILKTIKVDLKSLITGIRNQKAPPVGRDFGSQTDQGNHIGLEEKLMMIDHAYSQPIKVWLILSPKPFF